MDLRQFKEEYEKIILTADSLAAFKLLSIIKANQLTGIEKLEREIIILKWLAVDRLMDEEVMQLFRENLLEAFSIDFDLLGFLKARFLFIAEKNWDDYKKQILENIRNNQQLISENRYINRQGKSLPSTITTWVNEYISQLGAMPLTTIEILNFYRDNKNFQSLADESQAKLRQLINLIEWLKHSGFSLKGLPEAFSFLYEGQYYGIIDGQVYPAKLTRGEVLTITPGPQAVKRSDYQKLEKHYRQILADLINQDKFKAAKQAVKTAEIVLSDFKSRVAAGDLPAIMAGLEKIIQFKSLNSLLFSKDFGGEFDLYLESRLGAAARGLMRKVAPEFLSLFLQFLFINKLKLSLEESAVLALYLANVLAKTGEKQFLPMVYGDVKSGAFKWREIAAENGQLKFR